MIQAVSTHTTIPVPDSIEKDSSKEKHSEILLSRKITLIVVREVTRIVHFWIQASNFAELLIGISCLRNVF